MRIRVMSYNVHRCVGTDGADSAARIARVVAEANPDVVALQELDTPEAEDDACGAGGSGDSALARHHAREIAAPLGMDILFRRTFARNVGHYGHALLSRHAMTLQRSENFVRRGDARSEPRGAIWASVSFAGVSLQVVSTHLGLSRADRAHQSRQLLGGDWLGSPAFAAPGILCGDLNAIAHAMTYRRISKFLRDAQRVAPGHQARATFPSRFPLIRLDHVFVTPDVRVVRVTVPTTPTARHASDHLPLIVDLEVG